MTEQEIKEIVEKGWDCRRTDCPPTQTCAICIAHELYTKLNQPVPENLIEKIAKILFCKQNCNMRFNNCPLTKCKSRNIFAHERKHHGWPFVTANDILSLIQPVIENLKEESEARLELLRRVTEKNKELRAEIDKAREEGRREVMELLRQAHDFLDRFNGSSANKKELCFVCHSNTADGSGIDHKDWCVIQRIRKVMKEWGLSKEAQSE
jgi:hypothetical protein